MTGVTLASDARVRLWPLLTFGLGSEEVCSVTSSVSNSLKSAFSCCFLFAILKSALSREWKESYTLRPKHRPSSLVVGEVVQSHSCASAAQISGVVENSGTFPTAGLGLVS